MKGKSILKVVLATILVVALCTWIFPSASFQTTLVEGERYQAGIFDLLSYPMVALTYFGYVVLYALTVGMFYGVANKISAYHALIEKLQKSYKSKEYLFLSIVMILTAVIVSVTGLSFGMIFIFPFIISVVFAMGYNKLVAASVTVGPVVAGLAGTTLGSSTVSYMNQLLGTDIMNEMVSKVVILIAFIVILVANVLHYANKTKNNVVEAKVSTSTKKVDEEESVKKTEVKKTTAKKTSTTTKAKETKSPKNSASKNTKSTSKTKKSTKTKAAMAKNDSEVLKVKESKTKKQAIWPFVLIFDLVVVILGISVFDWAGLFELTWFVDATDAVTSFEVLGFPIFGKILGTISEFGSWSLNIEIPALIMIATLVLALVYRVKMDDLAEGIENGIKKAVKPAITMLLTYVVLIIVTYHPFQLLITKFLLDLTSGLNVVTMSIIAMFSSLFNVETVYVAQSTMPYVTSVITDSSLYPLIGVIFQSIYGLMMLVVPTSTILVGVLSYLDVPYGQWLKHIWKVFVELLVVLLIIFLIILAI